MYLFNLLSMVQRLDLKVVCALAFAWGLFALSGYPPPRERKAENNPYLTISIVYTCAWEKFHSCVDHILRPLVLFLPTLVTAGASLRHWLQQVPEQLLRGATANQGTCRTYRKQFSGLRQKKWLTLYVWLLFLSFNAARLHGNYGPHT